MKKLIFLAAFLVTATGMAQINVDRTGGHIYDGYPTTKLDALSNPRKGMVVRDSTLNTLVYYNGTAWVELGSGSGDVTAASAFGTDNRLIKSDGTGKGVQSTGITIDDSNNVSGIGNLNMNTNSITNASSLSLTGRVNTPQVRFIPNNTIGNTIDQNSTGFKTGNVFYLQKINESNELGFNFNALTADRTITFPDADVDLGNLGGGTPADDSITPAMMANGDFGAFSIFNNVAALDNNSVTGNALQDFSIYWAKFNTAILTNQAQAEAGTDDARIMTPLRTAQAIAAQTSDDQTLSLSGTVLSIEDGDSPIDLNSVFATDAELASASGVDSGQGMVIQSKNGVTETFDNSDVVSGGTSGAKRVFTLFSGQSEITLDATITEYGQPFPLLHNSASDSTLVKKGTGTTFKIAGQGILATDGFYFKNFETPVVIALASNDFLISISKYSEYTAPSGAIYDGQDPTDPTTETSDVSGYVSGNGHTWTSSTVRSTNGTRSSRLVTSATVADSNIPLIGTVSGASYTVSVDVYSATVSGNNYLWLDPARGWSGADVDGVTYELIPTAPGWTTITLTATASQNNAPLWFSMGSVITIDVDNIVITQN